MMNEVGTRRWKYKTKIIMNYVILNNALYGQ